MVIKIKDSDKLSTNMIMNIRVQYLIKKKRVHLIIKYCILLIIGMLNCFMYQKLSSVMFVLDSNSVFSTISITVSLTAFAFILLNISVSDYWFIR